ncbi:MAG TPA: VWA domain-containing protein, partial [Gemmatimonadaceae bacterium]|nr:VWA domain-containing protein [Gemmatimonadaceae bacterium]
RTPRGGHLEDPPRHPSRRLRQNGVLVAPMMLPDRTPISGIGDGQPSGRSPVALWRRWRARRRPALELDAVRRRLELLLRAMYDRPILIVDADDPREHGLGARLRRLAAGRASHHTPLPATDGESLYLPRSLPVPAGAGDAEALARYRLLAMEQAERLARGTAALAPSGDPLERDLYLLSESAAVDAAISRAMPGAATALAAARSAALAARPNPGRLSRPERDVEALVRQLLAPDAARALPAELAPRATAEESLAWAREMARRIRERHGHEGVRYRGVPPVPHWGTVRAAREGAGALAPSPMVAEEAMDALRHRIELPVKGTRAEAREPGESGEEGPQGYADSRGRRVEHERGAPVRAESSGGEEGSDAGDAPEAEVEQRPIPPGVLPQASPAVRDDDDTSADTGIPYPEWDAGASRYRQRAVLVRSRRPREGDPAWGSAVRREHAALVRQVRQRFEMLRARRTRLGHQRDGDELDLSACVRAMVDRRTGHGVDDRLYLSVRPARQSIAIALLVDVSGSTDTQVTVTRQVIDVEKVALLLAGEALDALGDPYTMLAFSSRGASRVHITTVKDFTEPSGDAVRRRIAALRPGGNTRLGAAVRHATSLLVSQNAGHRLLLILSDGRPNDSDGYHERYGVEDARQSILEARASAVFPFCLTVDHEGAAYLPRIFGAAGHTILRDPEHLPLALLQVVRHLLAT